MEEEKRAYYAIIPASVRYDKGLPAAAKLLFGEITALCNERGYCWAGNAYFSKLYDVSERTIIRWIKDLERGGYIASRLEYKPGSKEVARRLLSIPEAGGFPRGVVTKMSGGSDKNVTGGGDKNVTDNNTIYNITTEYKDIETAEKIDYQAIVDDYNKTCDRLPKVKYLSDARKRTIKARLRTMDPGQLHQAFVMANSSKFLTGQVNTNGRAFRASLDWILKEANIAKVLDGNYSDRPQASGAPREFYTQADTLPF